MVLDQSKKIESQPTFEDIEKALKANPELRRAVLKVLARDHAKDFLAHVNIKANLLNELSTGFVSSDKEWQE